MARFTLKLVLCGYHVYKEAWIPSPYKELTCTREEDNPHDPFAVAVKNIAGVVGHMPKLISAASSLFIRKGGNIICIANA